MIEKIADTIRAELVRYADNADIRDRWDEAVVSVFRRAEVKVDGETVKVTIAHKGQMDRAVAHWLSNPIDSASEVLGVSGAIDALGGDTGYRFTPHI